MPNSYFTTSYASLSFGAPKARDGLSFSVSSSFSRPSRPREPLGLSNTAIGGDSVLATDKIRVTIQKNPGSSQAEHFGNLSLSGYDISTDHVMTSVKDGLTVNGERFPMTAEGVMNASLYEDRTLGRTF